MELGIVLHEGDSLAFDGVGDEAGGLAFGGRGFLEGFADSDGIVTVELNGVPAEGAPFIGDGRDIHNVLDEAIELNAVVIDDGDDVIELVERAGHGGFPDLAFLNLAISEHAVRAGFAAIEAGNQPHADSEGEALAQGAGGGFEGMDEPDVGVALIDGAEFAEGVELVERRLGIAGLGHDGVEDRGGVTLRENEAIAIGQGGIVRIDAHLIEEELDEDFDRGEGSAGMAGLGSADHLDDFTPYTFGDWL